jgi:hypothetical protein
MGIFTESRSVLHLDIGRTCPSAVTIGWLLLLKCLKVKTGLLIFLLLLELFKDHVCMETLLDTCQKVVVELTDILLLSYLNRITEVINDRVKDSRGVRVFLIRFGKVRK